MGKIAFSLDVKDDWPPHDIEHVRDRNSGDTITSVRLISEQIQLVIRMERLVCGVGLVK